MNVDAEGDTATDTATDADADTDTVAADVNAEAVQGRGRGKVFCSYSCANQLQDSIKIPQIVTRVCRPRTDNATATTSSLAPLSPLELPLCTSLPFTHTQSGILRCLRNAEKAKLRSSVLTNDEGAAARTASAEGAALPKLLLHLIKCWTYSTL